MLYKDWLDEWLTNYIKPSSKDKTYKRYVNVATKHLVPKLGHYELTDITPLLVQRYITELLQSGNLKNGKGLSPNSVNSMIVVIQGSMEMAFVLGMTPRYEMDKLKRPKAVEKEVEVFSPNEQKKLEAAVMSDKRSKMKGVMLCLYTGLRIGELLALEWTDVDFQRMEITVSKTCHDGTDENGKYTRIIETPKTENSRRVIPFPTICSSMP